MPIVNSAVSGSPLSQGDILRGITLFATKESWREQRGEPAKAPFKFCMVVSRPCVLAHKQHITVAGVERYARDTPRECDTFDRVIDFLSGARDGLMAPDVFYLGQLPGLTGRYCARLDSLHPIEIPPPGLIRDGFVESCRIASLDSHFIRSLHVRLFNSYANLGYDDHAWPSTEDLQWIVTQGQADLARLDADLTQLQALRLSRNAEGKPFADKELTSLEARREALARSIEPFRAELQRRRGQFETPDADQDASSESSKGGP